ncbi:hypothetical protein AVEN_77067-1 [Araneus ventricosus]|uniref:Uncharacterized protein n=1 Tax=Araneus ventricosus TaxID=182803 RepID=A0A4Y2G8U8_ARAVE|nr:hypothetical protein AVEN_77067-1 [Araneus ventricosus]
MVTNGCHFLPVTAEIPGIYCRSLEVDGKSLRERALLKLPGGTPEQMKFAEFGALRFYDRKGSTCWMVWELAMIDSPCRSFSDWRTSFPGKIGKTVSHHDKSACH